MIRVARADDAPAVQAIYAPCVTGSSVTFETEVPGIETMRQRIESRLTAYPWLVLEQDGAVRGYAYASRFRDRAAYDWCVETSVYVHVDARRQRIARRLYAALIEVLTLQGFTQAMGVITLPGTVSIALHEALGFTPAGVWRHAGFKHGQWYDVGVWQRSLAEATTPPAPPRWFAAMADSPALQAVFDATSAG